jgi:hypothetical protein
MAWSRKQQRLIEEAKHHRPDAIAFNQRARADRDINSPVSIAT